jgi:hypothetical protein
MGAPDRFRRHPKTALKLGLTVAIGLGRHLMTALNMNVACPSGSYRRPITPLKRRRTETIGASRHSMTPLRLTVTCPSGLRRRPHTASTTAVAAVMVAIMIAVVALVAPPTALAQNYTVDTAASESLTNYLRQNRLPLVGAQIGASATGSRRLVLYGYVATQQGKNDAESKAVAYLGTPQPEVIDRIVIQPEIAKMRSGGQSGDSSADQAGTGSVGDYSSAGTGGAPAGAFPGQSFDQVVNDIQRYGIKDAPGDTGP